MNPEEPARPDPDLPGADDLNESKSKRYFPDIRWVVVWIILIGLLIFLNLASEKIETFIPVLDQAFRNLLTSGTLLVISATMVVWFAFFSDYGTRGTRLLTFWVLIGVQVLIAIFFVNWVEFNGDMAPIAVRWPGQQAKDYGLETPPAENSMVDLTTETPDDFPQFLGPQRDGRLPNTYFAYDWVKKEPKLLWKRPIGPGHSGFATRNGFAITMEQRGDQELTTCYDIETGDLKWSYAEKTRHHSWLGKLGPRSTPTIFDGFVYCLGANGHLACLEGSNGKLVWKKDLFQQFGTSISEERNTVTWGRAASPLVFDDKVVVPAGGPGNGPYVSLVCYQRKTGEELWRAGETQISYASPMLMPYLDTRVGWAQCIVSVNESNVTAHVPSNGEILWKVDRPGNSNSNASTSQPVTL
ncbi:MAG: PQQ-binding-like beta-propeller repeat protein, partial [Planctomycetota bacterium]|nr:PQQ-binding-like beta-propeller repeat protein [Planctomycetota bacterium]